MNTDEIRNKWSEASMGDKEVWLSQTLDEIDRLKELLAQAHDWLLPKREVHPGEPAYSIGFISKKRLDEWMNKYQTGRRPGCMPGQSRNLKRFSGLK